MLFKYYIQHESQQEHVGYAVASKNDEVLDIAKARFAGWAVGSCAGAVPVKDMRPKKLDKSSANLGWIHPMFKDF